MLPHEARYSFVFLKVSEFEVTLLYFWLYLENLFIYLFIYILKAE